MGKINGTLKCVFGFVNALFGVVGGLMIFGLIKAHTVDPQESDAVSPWAWFLLWTFSLGMLLVPILGMMATWTESTALLKGFAGLMVAGLIIMLISGIVTAVNRKMLKELFENFTPDNVSQMMKESSLREALNEFQGMFQCCGFMNYYDWGSSIPESCACSESSVCTDRPQYLDGPAVIYSRPCWPIISSLVYQGFPIIMGISFSFTVTALLCLGASLLMIGQVRLHDGWPRGQAIAMTTPGY